jgi:two-component system chemotaxis response regulator CheB
MRGAVDFVSKPDLKLGRSTEAFIEELINKIKIASTANIAKSEMLGASTNSLRGMSPELKNKIIAIGASTGGTEALHRLLGALPQAMPGIVIVQHIPPVFSQMFADRLNSSIKLRVKEAQTGDYVEEGLVLIAPGDAHLKIKKIGDRYKAELFKGEKVNGHCPSLMYYSNQYQRHAAIMQSASF